MGRWLIPQRKDTVEERATERLLASEVLWILVGVSAAGLVSALLGWGGSLWAPVIGVAFFQWIRLRRNRELPEGTP